MLQRANEGTCLWCGYGDPHVIVELAYERNMARRAIAAPAPRLATAHAHTGPVALWDETSCVRAARAWELACGELPDAMAWITPKRPGERRPSYWTVKKIFGSWPAFMNAIADVPREQALEAALVAL